MFLQKCLAVSRTIPKCPLTYPASFRPFSASPAWSNADQTLTSKNETFSYFRTSENNPANHTLSHVGRIYTVRRINWFNKLINNTHKHYIILLLQLRDIHIIIHYQYPVVGSGTVVFRAISSPAMIPKEIHHWSFYAFNL